jgi:hypothetical protein
LLGGAAVALPSSLELLGRRASAQAVPQAKYAVFCYTPDGVNESAFWPTGTTTSYQLSRILAPFEPYKDKLLIMGPMMNGAAPVSGTGLSYCVCGGIVSGNTAPLQHQAPICLTARGQGANGDLPYADQTKAVNLLDGPSIDTVIGAAVQKDSAFATLNFGLHPVGGDTPSDINFSMNGTPLTRMASADEAFTRVFANPVMGAAAAAAATTELHKTAALSDYLHGRFSALKSQVSAYDLQILDGHLTSLRTYEERKKQLLMGQSGSCAVPKMSTVPTDDTSVRTGADTEQLSPFFMDIISAAFACNLTKVASVSFGYPGGGDAGGLRMPWLGFTDPLHSVSHHGGDATKLDKYAQMSTWIAGQIAYLMKNLAAIPDGTTGKTLLDATVIYWFNRHGDGDTHSNTNLPNVLLGGAGGYFKMGRYLQLPATNPTRVLLSIANAMGVSVPSFGKDSWLAMYPLDDLVG